MKISKVHAIYALPLFATFLMLFSAQSALAKETGEWKIKTQAQVKTTYSTNIFNLSKSQQDGLEANNADDQTSGRYTDMENVGDLIISPAIELNLKHPARSGKDLNLKTGLTYKQYLLNTKKSYPKFDFQIEQDLGSDASIGFEFAYKFDVFKKNYLSDAVDGDASLNITPDERIYSEGSYNSMLWDLTYSRRLWKKTKGTASYAGAKKVVGNFLAGMEKRTYDSPFANRDSDTFRLGAGVDISLESKTDLEISYLYESIDVPVASEVLIRDEDDFGIDFNGSGGAPTDQDVRIVDTVDRSRTDHNFRVKAKRKLDKIWTGEAGYGLRFQDYSSNERYDVTRKGRRDTRHTFALGLSRKYNKKISLDLGWKYTTETANRSGLGDINEAEDKPYNKHILSAVFSYKL